MPAQSASQAAKALPLGGQDRGGGAASPGAACGSSAGGGGGAWGDRGGAGRAGAPWVCAGRARHGRPAHSRGDGGGVWVSGSRSCCSYALITRLRTGCMIAVETRTAQRAAPAALDRRGVPTPAAAKKLGLSEFYLQQIMLKKGAK